MDGDARELEKRMHDRAVEDIEFQKTHGNSAYAERMATRWVKGLQVSSDKGAYFERVAETIIGIKDEKLLLMFGTACVRNLPDRDSQTQVAATLERMLGEMERTRRAS